MIGQRELVARIGAVSARPKLVMGRCVYCGVKTAGNARSCVEHRGLLAIERNLGLR